MNAPAVIKVNVPSLLMDEAELMKVLSSSLYPGAKPESIKLVIGYCRAGGFDPMQKPVHIVPMSVKTGKKKPNSDWDEYEMRDVIMPGVGLYRTLAARTEEYAGMSDPEFGPAKTFKFQVAEWYEDEGGRRKKKFVDGETQYPEWCKVTVRRIVQGQVAEFSAKEYWLENYATAGKDTTAPNAMWKKRPFGQLAKCAEAQALRKGFPEAGAEPTADEMAGKSLDDGVVIDHGTGEITPRAAIQQPQSKSATPAANSSNDQSGAAAPASNGDALENGGGGAADQEKDTRPMAEGQKNVLRAKIKNAGLNDVDLFAKFGRKLGEKGQADVDEYSGWLFSHFNDVMAWINARTAGGQSQ
jgi:phage recombination protein Bet